MFSAIHFGGADNSRKRWMFPRFGIWQRHGPRLYQPPTPSAMVVSCGRCCFSGMMKVHVERRSLTLWFEEGERGRRFDRRPGTSGPIQDRALARVLQSNMESRIGGAIRKL